MKNGLNIKFIQIIGIIAPLFLLTSCLNTEDEAAAEQAKIDNYVKDSGFTKLPSGIYIKFYDTDRKFDSTKSPKPGQTCIITFTGRTTDGDILETTDENIGEISFPGLKFVYGPFRTKKGNTKLGIDTALYYFNPGDMATLVIPSYLLNFDYVPKVYTLGLNKIIEDDSTYEADNFLDFLVKSGFDTAKPDTFSYGFYWKGVLNTSPYPFKENDSAIINLTARYAETYDGNTQGRIFYPLVDEPQYNLVRLFEGQYYYPFLPIIDTALKHMNVGDILEVAALSDYAYGINGFNEIQYGLKIVPSNMPVCYQIELVRVGAH
jgi:FKBP-type peptidyl-prolyl cis-trans isomerase 2